MVEISKRDLKILETDFKNLFSAIEDERKKDSNIKLDIFPTEEDFPWFRFYSNNSDYQYRTIETSPLDYIKIRSNQNKTREFLYDLLDSGQLKCGCTAWGQDWLENSWDYPLWMYLHSTNKTFRENLETCVVDIIKDEFKREYDFEFDSQDLQYPQFNRLVGLLEMVKILGSKDKPIFESTKSILHRKISDKFLADIPDLDIGWGYEAPLNCYTLMIEAYLALHKELYQNHLLYSSKVERLYRIK